MHYILNTLLYIIITISVLVNDLIPIVFIDDRAPEWYYKLQWFKLGAMIVIATTLYILKNFNLINDNSMVLMISYIVLTTMTIMLYYKNFDKETKKRSKRMHDEYMKQPIEVRNAMERGPEVYTETG